MSKITTVSGLRMDWRQIRVDVGRPHGRLAIVTERETMEIWIKVMTMDRFNID